MFALHHVVDTRIYIKIEIIIRYVLRFDKASPSRQVNGRGHLLVFYFFLWLDFKNVANPILVMLILFLTLSLVV